MGDRRETVLLGASDVSRLLPMADCIAAVESAFLDHGRGQSVGPVVSGLHVDGGGFHIKTAGLKGANGPLLASKINANFPGNPDRFGLPTIQGVLALFDAANGRLLALMDSGQITSLRTAAATAVAARYLAPADCDVALCGCGEQSRHQLRALACVRWIARLRAYDLDHARAERFATDMRTELKVPASVMTDLEDSAGVNTWITCTSAHQWFLGRAHVAPGSFVAAVGTDHADKQEIEPELLAASAVVADIVDQCATMGDLHHALEAGVMRREDVRAELASVVTNRRDVRRSADEIVVFDSTGTALQDVAAAAVAYDRAVAAGDGMSFNLGSQAELAKPRLLPSPSLS